MWQLIVLENKRLKQWGIPDNLSFVATKMFLQQSVNILEQCLHSPQWNVPNLIYLMHSQINNLKAETLAWIFRIERRESVCLRAQDGFAN